MLCYVTLRNISFYDFVSQDRTISLHFMYYCCQVKMLLRAHIITSTKLLLYTFSKYKIFLASFFGELNVSLIFYLAEVNGCCTMEDMQQGENETLLTQSHHPAPSTDNTFDITGVQSPPEYVKILNMNINRLYNDIHNGLYDNIFNKLYDNIFNKLYDNIFNKLYYNIFNKLYDNIFNKLYYNIFNKLYDNIFNKLYYNVYNKLYT